jgi:hypothetical protein
LPLAGLLIRLAEGVAVPRREGATFPPGARSGCGPPTCGALYLRRVVATVMRGTIRRIPDQGTPWSIDFVAKVLHINVKREMDYRLLRLRLLSLDPGESASLPRRASRT